MIVGMDFGTTNTGAAIYSGEELRLLALDPESPTPQICRSAIYMTRAGEFLLGSAALNTYFQQNIGRPTRYKKIWIGEIVQVYAEVPTFYEDVYVFEDEFSPGRLFVSIKTALRSQQYHGTVFQGNWYLPSDLAAVFLTGMRMQLERTLAKPVKEVVLGRPVHFSTNPEEDRLAQGRLLDGAFKAGFERVFLEYEPVAAALSYERTLKAPETVLVFDFGGGTLDFTIIEIGGKERRVHATGGIPVAGDLFDQRLFRATIPPHLGEGDYFVESGKRYPIPAHIFDSLTDPNEILTLNLPHNWDVLQGIHQGAIHKEKTQALLQVVSSNYALILFDLVERAKCRLSEELVTPFEFSGSGILIREDMTRARFERAIGRDYDAIRQELVETISRSGLQPGEIDRVIRTGGSSQIPLFIHLLNDLFGPEKVRSIDTFSSVTSGLAIRGHQVGSGQVDLPVFIPDSPERAVEQASPGFASGDAQAVDLGTVRKRLEVRLEQGEDGAHIPEYVWVLLHSGNLNILDEPDPSRFLQPDLWADGKALIEGLALNSGDQVVRARSDSALILATDCFKLISTRIRDMFLAQQVEPNGIRRLLPLEGDESVATMTCWRPESVEKTWLGMITSVGQARTFDADLLAEHLSKKPFFQLERRYSGVPAALFPVGEGELIILGTSIGRIVAVAGEDVSINALELYKMRTGEAFGAVVAVKGNQPLAMVNHLGACLTIDPTDYIFEKQAPGRSQFPRRNFTTIGFLPLVDADKGEIVGLTSRGRLIPIHSLPGFDREKQNTPQKLFHLGFDERLVAILRY